jgi:hypothetical protein
MSSRRPEANLVNDDCLSVIASFLDIRSVTSFSQCSKRFYRSLHNFITSVHCTMPEHQVRRPVLYQWLNPSHKSVSSLTTVVLVLPRTKEEPSTMNNIYTDIGLLLSSGVLRRLERLFIAEENDDLPAPFQQGYDLLFHLAAAAKQGFLQCLETLCVSVEEVGYKVSGIMQAPPKADLLPECNWAATDGDVELLLSTVAENCPRLTSVAGRTLLVHQFYRVAWPHVEEVELDTYSIYNEVSSEWDDFDDEDECFYRDMFVVLRNMTVERFPALRRIIILNSEDMIDLYTFMVCLALLLEDAEDPTLFVFHLLTHLSVETDGLHMEMLDRHTNEWKRFSIECSKHRQELISIGLLSPAAGHRARPAEPDGRALSHSLCSRLPILLPNCRHLYCYHWLPSVEFMFLLGSGDSNSNDSGHCTGAPGLNLVLTMESANPALSTFFAQFTELCANSNSSQRFDISDETSDQAPRWNIGSLVLLHRLDHFTFGRFDFMFNCGLRRTCLYGTRRVPNSIAGSSAYNGMEDHVHSSKSFQVASHSFRWPLFGSEEGDHWERMHGCLSPTGNRVLVRSLHEAMKNEPALAFRSLRHLQLGLEFFLQDFSTNLRGSMRDGWSSLSRCLVLEHLTLTCTHCRPRSGAPDPLCRAVVTLLCELRHAAPTLRSLTTLEIIFSYAAQHPDPDGAVVDDLVLCASNLKAELQGISSSRSAAARAIKVVLKSHRPDTGGVRCITLYLSP